jgi:predicted glycosyltransferase involved in capsule biosynthesis
MSKLDKFTFLMPIFNLKDERYENFKYVLAKIKEVTDNIIVVEQVKNKRSTKSKKFTESLGVKYLPVLIDDDSIHKSKLINIGTDNIQTEFVWVNDSDCYLKFQKVIDQLDFRHNFIQPYDVGKYISKEETEKIFNGESVQIEFAYSKLSETGQHITPGTLYYVSMYGALSFLYNKKAFYKIGGMNENYTGWGLEDNSLCMRMFEYKDARLDIINLSGIHLYHPRGGYEAEQYNDRTINNVRFYEEEFNNKSYALHDKLVSYYKKRDENKIAIIGIERSGTTLLREGIFRILNLTDYNEPFHLLNTATVPEYVDINTSLSDYLLFFNKKSNRCIKHLDSLSVCANKYNISQPEYRDIIKKNLVINSSEIIITTRNNFMDWITSFSLALKNNEWCNVGYTCAVDIPKQEFEWMYNNWQIYHTQTICETINLCKRYNKRYKIIDYDDIINTDGDFNDIDLDITYKNILSSACIKKQKTKENSYYIKNYEEVKQWYHKKRDTIFIMTRFSNACADLEYYKDIEWLNRRIELFEFNFKSIQSQTHKNFKWLISVHPETCYPIIEKLKKYKSQLPQIEIVYTEGGIWGGDKIYINDNLSFINNVVKNGTFTTLWHDSDDILLYDTVLEELAAAIELAPINTIALSTKTGRASVSELLLGNIRYSLERNSTFIALKSNIEQQMTIFNIDHSQWINDKSVNIINMPEKARHLKINSDDALTNCVTTLKYLINSKEYFTDKATTHCYINKFYNSSSSFIIERKLAKNILEIGVCRGGSIKLWRDYFERATIYGIDKNLSNLKYDFSADLRVKLIEQDIYSNIILNDLPLNIDFIIDNASHTIEDQIYAFNKFFPLLKKGGSYIIEDIQNIDRDKQLFLPLADNVEIYDFRYVNNRYDDVIIKITK